LADSRCLSRYAFHLVSMQISARVWVFIQACVRVCVCAGQDERERGREREKEKEKREKEKESRYFNCHSRISIPMRLHPCLFCLACVRVCVCVCVCLCLCASVRVSPWCVQCGIMKTTTKACQAITVSKKFNAQQTLQTFSKYTNFNVK